MLIHKVQSLLYRLLNTITLYVHVSCILLSLIAILKWCRLCKTLLANTNTDSDSDTNDNWDSVKSDYMLWTTYDPTYPIHIPCDKDINDIQAMKPEVHVHVQLFNYYY